MRNFDASIEILREEGDLIEDLELPELPFDAAASVIIDAEAASAFEPIFESGRVTELTAPPEDRLGGYPGQVILAKDYLRASPGAPIGLRGSGSIAEPGIPITLAAPASGEQPICVECRDSF